MAQEATRAAAFAVLAIGGAALVGGLLALIILRGRTSIRLRFPVLVSISALFSGGLLLVTLLPELSVSLSCLLTMPLGYACYVLMTWPVVVRAALFAAIRSESGKLEAAYRAIFSPRSGSDEYLAEAKVYVRNSSVARLITRRATVFASFALALVACGVFCVMLALFVNPYNTAPPADVVTCKVLEESYVAIGLGAFHALAFLVCAANPRHFGASFTLRPEVLLQFAVFAAFTAAYGVLELPSIANQIDPTGIFRTFLMAVLCLVHLFLTLLLPVMLELCIWNSRPFEAPFPMLSRLAPEVPRLQPIDPEAIVETQKELQQSSPTLAPIITITASSPKLSAFDALDKPEQMRDVSGSDVSLRSEDSLDVTRSLVRRESLNKMLEDDAAASEFQLFLVHEFSAENLFFYRMANKFAQTTKKISQEMRLEWARRIYNDFFGEGVRTLNVTAEVKNDIAARLTLEGVHPNMFAAAQEEVRVMMERDSYPRFLAYKQNGQLHLDPMQRENAIKRHYEELRLQVDRSPDDPWNFPPVSTPSPRSPASERKGSPTQSRASPQTPRQHSPSNSKASRS